MKLSDTYRQPTEQLQLNRLSLRRERLALSGPETYSDGTLVRQLAVWKASLGKRDTRNVPLDELPVAPGALEESDGSTEFYKTLAAHLIADWAGVDPGETEKLGPSYPLWVIYVESEIEAELLRRLHPDFTASQQEAEDFEAQMVLSQLLKGIS